MDAVLTLDRTKHNLCEHSQGICFDRSLTMYFIFYKQTPSTSFAVNKLLTSIIRWVSKIKTNNLKNIYRSHIRRVRPKDPVQKDLCFRCHPGAPKTRHRLRLQVVPKALALHSRRHLSEWRGRDFGFAAHDRSSGSYGLKPEPGQHVRCGFFGSLGFSDLRLPSFSDLRSHR